MNRIYKVIWSRTRNCYVAASEFAKGRGKPSSSGRKKVLAAALAALMLTGAGTGISLAAADDDVSIGANVAQGSDATIFYAGTNTTGQIAIGKHAYVRVNNNMQESLLGIDGRVSNTPGGIAIGSNTYARTGSIMIGSHVYKGNIGDVRGIDTTTTYNGDPNVTSGFNTSETGAYGHMAGETTIGTNSFTKGMLATTIGDYNIQSGRISPTHASSLVYGTQNFGATVIGALNSNESQTGADGTALGSYSGIANSIIGTANQVNNSNGTMVFGAGNTVRNSLGTTGMPSAQDVIDLQDKSATGAASLMRQSVSRGNGGGATVVLGSGNDVTDSSHIYTIGTNNDISNSSNSIVFGDGYTGNTYGISGLTNSIVIGNSLKTPPGYYCYRNMDKAVSIGNENMLEYSSGAVVIGNNNIMMRDGAVGYGYDTGNVAIGNDTYIDSYANQGDSIAIGKRASVSNMLGTPEHRYAFGRSESNYSGSIAIGENSFARSGSTMIGVHSYQGDLADMTIDSTNGQVEKGGSITGKYQRNSVNATTVGNESYNSGVFSTVTGSYSATTGNTDTDINHYTQNFGATVDGSLNSIESYTSTNSNSGVASSILGTANRVANSSNTTVTGSGNVVTNSLAQVQAPTDTLDSAKALQDSFQQSLQRDTSGGIVVSGTGNTVDHSTGSTVIGSRNRISGDDTDTLTDALVLGNHRTVEAGGDHSIILGSADDAMTTNNQNVTILGHNANATVDGGVALGSGSIASRASGIEGYDPAHEDHSSDTTGTWRSTAGAVSVGSGTTTRQITNVAAGSEDTDAVNVAQLKNVHLDLTNLDNRVTSLTGDVYNLNGRVSRLDNKINKVGAGAAALAALHPLDFNPEDKWDFAIGYGNYRNANSVAVGAFYRPNANTMFSVGTSFGNGENMFNAGASFKFGKGSSYSGVSKAELAAENEQLKKNDALQDQKIQSQDEKIQKQDQEIQELKQQLADLASRIK